MNYSNQQSLNKVDSIQGVTYTSHVICTFKLTKVNYTRIFDYHEMQTNTFQYIHTRSVDATQEHTLRVGIRTMF